jgi:tetratricopeptide (TPR) repeat protein
MKKAVIASLLMAASFAPHSTRIALGQDAGQVQMPAAEYASYNACASATTPAAKAPACEAYLTAYPQSAVKADVLQQLMIAYSQIPANDKALDAADRLLQVDPNNLRGITFEVILRKQAADMSTDPAAKQAGLDAAASYATKGLAATKPKDMTEADFDALKKGVTPNFYSAIATAALAKKDDATAITDYKAELASVPVDMTTKPGAILQDVYELGIAYYQSTPPDYVDCTWYTSRAAAFAPEPYKSEFLKVATYCYKKFHGKADGYDAVTAAVATNLNPPAGFTITPAPSPADIVADVIKSTPDLSTLAIGDKEFILANGKPEDAAKVWDTLKGKTVEIPDAVIVSATDTEITASVSDDSVQAKTADFTFKLKPIVVPEIPETGTPAKKAAAKKEAAEAQKKIDEIKAATAVGSKVNISGTYDSFTPSPLMITMTDAEVILPEKKKEPAKRAPVHHAAHK